MESGAGAGGGDPAAVDGVEIEVKKKKRDRSHWTNWLTGVVINGFVGEDMSQIWIAGFGVTGKYTDKGIATKEIYYEEGEYPIELIRQACSEEVDNKFSTLYRYATVHLFLDERVLELFKLAFPLKRTFFGKLVERWDCKSELNNLFFYDDRGDLEKDHGEEAMNVAESITDSFLDPSSFWPAMRQLRGT